MINIESVKNKKLYFFQKKMQRKKQENKKHITKE